MRLGLGQSIEDVVIAALVTMPFVLTLVVWLGWMIPLPSTRRDRAVRAGCRSPAALWNAGWRARTARLRISGRKSTC